MLRSNLGRKGWVNPYFLAMGRDLLQSFSVTTVLALRWDPVPVAGDERARGTSLIMAACVGLLVPLPQGETGGREVCP